MQVVKQTMTDSVRTSFTDLSIVGTDYSIHLRMSSRSLPKLESGTPSTKIMGCSTGDRVQLVRWPLAKIKTRVPPLSDRRNTVGTISSEFIG